MQKPEKWLKHWQVGTQLRVLWELSNEYHYDRVYMFLKNPCVLALWVKVASALEGLNRVIYLFTLWHTQSLNLLCFNHQKNELYSGDYINSNYYDNDNDDNDNNNDNNNNDNNNNNKIIIIMIIVIPILSLKKYPCCIAFQKITKMPV